MGISNVNIGSRKETGGCGCGGTETVDLPELNVQLIPHEVRHATIFGALDGIRPGRGLIICATHDPVPLLHQLAERRPGVFNAEYLEKGPENWRIKFTLAE